MDPARAAWQRKFAREPEPWSGPVHAAPLLADLRGRILELGAGGGKVSPALPPDTLALDWATLPPGRPGLLADARTLPVKDASIDALVAIHVLGHVALPPAGFLALPPRGSPAPPSPAHLALREWRRVLRPGGVLVLEVFARGDVRDVPGHVALREGIVTRFFDAAELRALLGEVGLVGDIVLEERVARWGTRRVLRGVFTAGGRPPEG